MSKNNNLSQNDDLTRRQRSILFAMVKEYCDHSATIGSKELKEKYNFAHSPATIRSELAKLRDKGFLFQPFTNAPSRPTEKSFKMFINQLLTGLQITTSKQRELQLELARMQEKQLNLDKEISRLLAIQAGGVGFSLDNETESYSGLNNLLEAKTDGKVSDIIDFLENIDTYKQPLLNHENEKITEIELIGVEEQNQPSQNVKAYFGNESTVLPLGKGYAMLTAKVKHDGKESVVGLIAPPHLLARKRNLELVEGLSKVLNNEKKGEDSEKNTSD